MFLFHIHVFVDGDILVRYIVSQLDSSIGLEEEGCGVASRLTLTLALSQLFLPSQPHFIVFETTSPEYA